jgi:hypothetical protein
MTHYLKVSFKDGSIYETSKEPQEGFEKNEWSVAGRSGVNYKKVYRKPISGALVSVKHRDTNFGQTLAVVLRNEDYFQIEVPLMDRDEISPFAENIIRQLPNLQKGMEYDVTGFVYQPEGSKYQYRGLTFRKDGTEKVEKSLSYQTANNPDGDIPPIEWKESMGKKKPNFEKRNDFLYNFMKKQLNENFGESQDVPSTPEPPKVEEKKPNVEDLPF